MINLIFRNGLFDYLCSNCDMTLHLILKTHWFNMIEQGNKRAYTNETMTYKIESISIGRGRAEWGAPSEDVYIIKFSEEV